MKHARDLTSAACGGTTVSSPLGDVRVVALEQYGAGPWATLQLADLGADVIKLEDPCNGGDVGRYVPPFQAGEDSLFFETFNRGKRSVSLDLRCSAGRSAFEALAARSDVVFCNLRGELPERLGLTYNDLARLNPRLVCCSLSGYGMTGPRRAEPSYDNVIQAQAGWMTLTGEPDGPPTKTGLSLVDISAGYVAAFSILAAVWRARRDGVGGQCDLSLFETALAELNYVGTWTATAGWSGERMPDSAHPSIVPFQNFRAADGILAVACSKEHFWRRFCAAIEREDLAEIPRFASFAARDEHREELVALLAEVIVARPREHWLQRLAAHGVPSAPLNDVAGALADPQAVARGDVVEFEHERFGRVCQVASPHRIGGERPPRRAPFRGEHTLEALREVAGLSNERIAALAKEGAFGPSGSDGASWGGVQLAARISGPARG